MATYQDWITTRQVTFDLQSGLTVTVKKFLDLLDLTALADIPLPLLEALSDAKDIDFEKSPAEAMSTLKRNVELLKIIADAALLAPREALPYLTFADLTAISSKALGREAAEDLKRPVQE